MQVNDEDYALDLLLRVTPAIGKTLNSSTIRLEFCLLDRSAYIADICVWQKEFFDAACEVNVYTATFTGDVISDGVEVYIVTTNIGEIHGHIILLLSMLVIPCI
ncbi:hypothetical protein D1Y84_14230 [Acidipila sp. EB88]|nr:hypothetical protein D1Y84_14230 [Acidipila sp. EB88]